MPVTINPLGPPFDFTGSGGSSSGIGGTIAATQVAFGTGVDTIGGSANFIWDGTDVVFTAAHGLLFSGTGTDPFIRAGSHGGSAAINIGGPSTVYLDFDSSAVLTLADNFSSVADTFNWTVTGAATTSIDVTTAHINLVAATLGTSLLIDDDGTIQLSTSGLIELDGPTMAWFGITFENATAVKPRPIAANTVLMQAYDVDGTAYKTFGTGTSGNTPSWDWSFPSGGTLTGNFTSLQVNGVPVGTGTIGGTIAVTQVAFGTGADTIWGDADLTYIVGTGQLINAGPLRIGAPEDATAQIELQGTTVASTTYNVALAANMTVTSAADNASTVLQAYYLDARVNVEHNSGTTSGHDFTNYVHVAAGKSTTGYVGEYFGQVITGPGTIDLHQGASFESNYNATQVGPAMSINFEAPNLSAGAALTSTFYYLNMANLSATTTGGAKGPINYGAGKFVVDSAGAVTGAGVSLTDTETLGWLGL